jgi:hypothetical protein
MSFKYTRLPCLALRRKRKKREKFSIDSDVEVIVESTAESSSSPGHVDIRFKQKKRRFSDDIVLDERTYDSFKQRVLDIRDRLNRLRLDSSEAMNDGKNCFIFNNGLTIFVGLNENRRVFVDFCHPKQRSQHVTLNESQYSALENMITRSIIDGAIIRLWKCME